MNIYDVLGLPRPTFLDYMTPEQRAYVPDVPRETFERALTALQNCDTIVALQACNKDVTE